MDRILGISPLLVHQWNENDGAAFLFVHETFGSLIVFESFLVHQYGSFLPFAIANTPQSHDDLVDHLGKLIRRQPTIIFITQTNGPLRSALARTFSSPLRTPFYHVAQHLLAEKIPEEMIIAMRCMVLVSEVQRSSILGRLEIKMTQWIHDSTSWTMQGLDQLKGSIRTEVYRIMVQSEGLVSVEKFLHVSLSSRPKLSTFHYAIFHPWYHLDHLVQLHQAYLQAATLSVERKGSVWEVASEVDGSEKVVVGETCSCGWSSCIHRYAVTLAIPHPGDQPIVLPRTDVDPVLGAIFAKLWPDTSLVPKSLLPKQAILHPTRSVSWEKAIKEIKLRKDWQPQADDEYSAVIMAIILCRRLFQLASWSMPSAPDLKLCTLVAMICARTKDIQAEQLIQDIDPSLVGMRIDIRVVLDYCLGTLYKPEVVVQTRETCDCGVTQTIASTSTQFETLPYPGTRLILLDNLVQATLNPPGFFRGHCRDLPSKRSSRLAAIPNLLVIGVPEGRAVQISSTLFAKDLEVVAVIYRSDIPPHPYGIQYLSAQGVWEFYDGHTWGTEGREHPLNLKLGWTPCRFIYRRIGKHG